MASLFGAGLPGWTTCRHLGDLSIDMAARNEEEVTHLGDRRGSGGGGGGRGGGGGGRSWRFYLRRLWATWQGDFGQGVQAK